MFKLLTILVLVLVIAQSGAAPSVQGEAPASTTIPLWLKISHTLFVCVLVPVYWKYYGVSNFLWFSDIALFVATAALWLHDPLLASTQAVSVALLELVWLVDFLVRCVSGVHLVGISKYMFKREIPLFLRGFSLFHVWLPFLLVWLVWRLGYDQRAFVVQTVIAVVVLQVCYWFTDPSANINWVFGPGEKAQRWMLPGWYLVFLTGFFVLCVYLPTHLLLTWLFAPPLAA